jgi:hypothetical protein
MDINIVGTWMNDTVLYLARIFGACGGTVLIRDYTRDKLLSACVPKVKGVDPGEVILDYAGVGYTYSRNSSEKYDTCIRLYDYNRLPDNEENFTLIIADESKAVSDALNSMDWSDFTDAGTKIALLIKYYTGVVRKQYDELMKKAAIKDAFVIPMNPHDMKCAVLTEFNDSFTFNSISAKYQESLIDILRLIRSDLGLSLKDAEKIFAKAAKGGKK